MKSEIRGNCLMLDDYIMGSMDGHYPNYELSVAGLWWLIDVADQLGFYDFDRWDGTIQGWRDVLLEAARDPHVVQMILDLMEQEESREQGDVSNSHHEHKAIWTKHLADLRTRRNQ